MPISVEELQQLLIKHDKGVLKQGQHSATDREFCALEFSAIVRGKPFSDSPGDLPDLRPLNDAFREDDTSRTKHLLPVLATYWDWQEWSEARKVCVMSAVVILTVNRIIAELPYIGKSARDACLAADNLSKAAANAANAADAANTADAADAANAASYAANAARYAANAAGYAASYAANAAGYAADAARYAAASYAADAAASYAADAASYAANAARYAAADAATAANYAAADAAAYYRDIHNKVLITACSIWIEAAKGGL